MAYVYDDPPHRKHGEAYRQGTAGGPAEVGSLVEEPINRRERRHEGGEEEKERNDRYQRPAQRAMSRCHGLIIEGLGWLVRHADRL
jgi:hypothetical protein